MDQSSKYVYNEIAAEPLTLENREVWFERIKNYLIARDLWKVTNGKSARPAKNPVKDYLRWKRKNAATLHIIQISCSPESFSQIKGVSEAKDAWHILNQTYNPPKPQPQREPQVVGEQVDFDVSVLHQALWKNKWGIAKEILEQHPSAWVARLDSMGQTFLHLAALLGLVGMVEEFMRAVPLPPEFLESLDDSGDTPLRSAAYGGVLRIAECFILANSRLPTLPHPLELPVTTAFSRGHKAMGRYLYPLTPFELLKPHNGFHGADLLYWCFVAGALDVALDSLQQCPELLFTNTRYGWNPIDGIAAMASAFSRGRELVFWKRWIYNYINVQSTTTISSVRVDIQQEDESKRSIRGLGLLHWLISHTSELLGMKELHELKLVHAQAAQILDLVCKNRALAYYDKDKWAKFANALFTAAKEGNVEFVVQVSKAYPQLILATFQLDWNIFFHAINQRQAEVFNLIHGLRLKTTLATQIDKLGDNMLHVAGLLAPTSHLNRFPGPALQFQTELQWFKEVEKVIPHGFKEIQNLTGLQPKDTFKVHHKELRNEGEKWMKETASSCSVVGALVVTIMFAAVFTVPGGNNQDFGYPIFLKKKLFVSFLISDALSLFSSSTSVLIFLGILTSRYAEEDFLKSLPTKLIIGLSTLFLSIASMMVAFSSCIFLILQHEYSWSFLPVIMLASVLVTLFVLLQFPLLVQMISSTYGRGFFNRNTKIWL